MPQTLLIGFRSEKLRGLIGKTLTEVAAMRGEDEIDTVLNLILEDRSRISAVFFLMNENYIKTILRRPSVSCKFSGTASTPARNLGGPYGDREK